MLGEGARNEGLGMPLRDFGEGDGAIIELGTLDGLGATIGNISFVK